MLSFLYVYSDHSILECYNLFSGVELSMRSFFVIIIGTKVLSDNLMQQLKEVDLEFCTVASGIQNSQVYYEGIYSVVDVVC